MESLLEQYNYCVKELNEKEVLLCGGYLRKTEMFVKKEWIFWLINTIRKMTPFDFENPRTFFMINSNDSYLAISLEIKDRDLSHMEIFSHWNDESKNAPSFSMPYPAGNEKRMMAYIEPVLFELSKYLPEEEQKKLVKPWECTMSDEEWEKYKGSSRDNNAIGTVKFVGEIDPKEYFCH